MTEEIVLKLTQGELDQAANEPVHEHMADCDDCRRLVAQVARSLSTEQGIQDGETFQPPEPRPASVPRIVGRYALIERIGAGGTGVIYRAHDPQLKRDVALKLLRTDRRSTATSSHGRLLREAQAMARLSHPNVVSVYDAGIFEGQVFIAMELVDGQTLRQWLRSEPRSLREVLEMFAATARGLEAAHAAGLVHRDFKPTNVLVGRDGRPRVTDFGLARAIELDLAGSTANDANPPSTSAPRSRPIEHTMTLAGTMLGTPPYMAPEQFLGEPTDARTDEFSFCVALYEALCGERPFAGETLLEIAAEVTAGNLRAAPPAPVPPAVVAAVMRGLQRDPGERYPTMAALLAALAEPAHAPPSSRRASRRLVGTLALRARRPAVFAVAIASGAVLAAAATVTLTPERKPLVLAHGVGEVGVGMAHAHPAPQEARQEPAAAPDIDAPPVLEPEPRPREVRRPPLRPRGSAAAPGKAAPPDDPELIRDPWSGR